MSAGAIAFFIERKAIKVILLLQNKPGAEVLDIGPKGKVNRGENVIAAAHREVREELGVPLHIDTNFRETEEYEFDKEDSKGRKQKIKKEVVYFIAYLSPKDRKQISLSEEHKKYYLLPIDEAVDKAQYANQKRILQDAKDYITLKYLT